MYGDDLACAVRDEIRVADETLVSGARKRRSTDARWSGTPGESIVV